MSLSESDKKRGTLWPLAHQFSRDSSLEEKTRVCSEIEKRRPGGSTGNGWQRCAMVGMDFTSFVITGRPFLRMKTSQQGAGGKAPEGKGPLSGLGYQGSGKLACSGAAGSWPQSRHSGRLFACASIRRLILEGDARRLRSPVLSLSLLSLVISVLRRARPLQCDMHRGVACGAEPVLWQETRAAAWRLQHAG